MGVNPRSGDQLFFGEVAAEMLARTECSLLFVAGEPFTFERPVTEENDGATTVAVPTVSTAVENQATCQRQNRPVQGGVF